MKRYINKLLFPIILGVSLSACQQDQDTNANRFYTPLSGATCQQRVLEEVTGSTADRCPGVANYQLDILYDDNRMSLDIITPDQNTHPLNLWDILPSGSSSLASNAEWRMKDGKPFALIVRVDTTDQSNINNPVRSSHLMISKITQSQICVVDKINAAQEKATEEANQVADNAANKPCLPTE
ncbi:hypothetical protein [Enterobacillus tribolii]|uniref:Lipoprotein n=1 Tax=Enterobacillus tribolii TaxID=1487935 RepID=A0A370Q6X9_9GAMM|nr:hypothetical protein [Enterobacillus tribolii]MBW7984926.1 hypothetical protein [Enterobacillus tribolii]RDK84138.1 hypothetical protein C8D90_11457 [Enterobacillus tribolii]